jgi:hypothetical protein
MIPEMQDDRGQAVRQMLLEALACFVLLGLRVVSAAREVGNSIFVADTFDDAEQRVLLNPNLRPKGPDFPKGLLDIGPRSP